MSYGLRRYEALHRLWWFVFFFLCLFLAWNSHIFTHSPGQSPALRDLGRRGFWTGLQGIGMVSPHTAHQAGKGMQPPETSAAQDNSRYDVELIQSALLFIIRAGIIFLGLRLLWLVFQVVGRYLLTFFMPESSDAGPLDPEAGTEPESLFPVEDVAARIRRSPLGYFLHPFIRLRLMLSGFQKSVSSEELLEKERRAVEADSHILYGSWWPYRCLFWVLPLLGLAQTALLLIAQFNIASSGFGSAASKGAFETAKPMLDSSVIKVILDTAGPAMNLLLPFIQAVVLAVFFQLAATLLRYFEELYLSNLDAFVYDRLLSRLPVRSNDTILILEALQRQFKELNAAFKKLESKVIPPTKVEK